jgi:alcohol dehydrogenase (cytochrome c)
VSNCVDVTIDTAKHNKENGWNGGVVKTADRYESDLTAVDPLTGEVEKTTHLSYPNYSGTLVTGGGLVFLGLTDGTFAAFDDMTLDQLWKVNIGSGFSAPPMTFAFDGKQYVAVVSGPSSPSPIEEHQHAGTQGDAKRHGALRVRALGAIVSWPESG